ncbi:MAG: glutamate--tRNA ligase [Myxococcota bacterium]|nr:glutamate--tRNA ligase [Myxococcota bacterium]MDW8361262.1 glutamate--tRNA ligase [Myxococcales bacterium]
MSEVRVRFAPSPTGYLHIGGVRTALFNWLWARRHGGSFILRIEDTDVDRNLRESTSVILESMRWLGLDWDEGPEVGGPHGPYFQSERLELYRAYAERLVATGHAFRCYATREEVEAARAAHEARGGRDFRFVSPWRDGRRPPPHSDAPYAIRLRAPRTGSTGFVDLVKGRIDVPNEQQQDFVLLRQNGLPLYNFACVVDDVEMGITLVARGDDHVVNTPPQLLLYEALGRTPPRFAHLPMILGQDGKKLSKRDGAVSTTEYRDAGYLPDALLNYLARLGWSHGDQEVFRRDELVALFDWSRVGATAARWDPKKLAYIQAEHLRALSDARIAELAMPFLERAGLRPDRRTLEAAVATVRTRAVTLVDVADMVDFYFREPPRIDEQAAARFLVESTRAAREELAALLETVEPFDAATLEARVHQWLQQTGRSLKQVAQPARVALTGRTASPGLFEVMAVLGKERTVARLRAADPRPSQLTSTGG